MERFSEQANRVVTKATEEADQLDHPYVGTEHLLLGLIAVDSPISEMLLAAGATADAARDKAAEAVGRGDAPRRSEREFSSRARRALERASRLSLNRRDAEVAPEHLLIGVLDVEGRAGQVLRGLGVDVVKLRDAVEPPSAAEPNAATAATTGHQAADRMPQCGVCGAELTSTLSYRVIPGDGQDGARRSFVVAFCSSCGAALGATAG